MFRREFLGLLGTGAGLTALPNFTSRLLPPDDVKPDATLRISPIELEIAPRQIIKTIGYNGSAPGPVLRFREGQRVTIDVFNDTKDPEIVHWHGLFIPSDVDGSVEEGTPLIPPKSSARYSFVVRPSGTRWYHTHVSAGRNLNRSTFTGQFGMLYIEPKNDPARYDAENMLCLHGWKPYLSNTAGEGTLEAAYEHFSINGRALGSGEPIKVREGQKVLFRILNANATLTHQLALAGHKFEVISLDGNPVPTPRAVDTLTLGPAERVDAVVTMNSPGVWILGELNDQIRNQGLGAVIEYENRTEAPQLGRARRNHVGLHYLRRGFRSFFEQCANASGTSRNYPAGLPQKICRKQLGRSLDHQRQGIPEDRSHRSPRKSSLSPALR